MQNVLLAFHGVGRGVSNSPGQSYRTWFAPSERLEKGSRVAYLRYPASLPSTRPSPHIGCAWSLLPSAASWLRVAGLVLRGSQQHFLTCFRPDQVDYLKPVIRLLKIILLAFGFVFSVPEVNEGRPWEAARPATSEGSWAVGVRTGRWRSPDQHCCSWGWGWIVTMAH